MEVIRKSRIRPTFDTFSPIALCGACRGHGAGVEPIRRAFLRGMAGGAIGYQAITILRRGLKTYLDTALWRFTGLTEAIIEAPLASSFQQASAR